MLENGKIDTISCRPGSGSVPNKCRLTDLLHVPCAIDPPSFVKTRPHVFSNLLCNPETDRQTNKQTNKSENIASFFDGGNKWNDSKGRDLERCVTRPAAGTADQNELMSERKSKMRTV